MKQAFAILFSVLTTTSAFAQAAQPNIQNRQRETGRFTVIEDTVGSCSNMSAFPQLDILGNATAISEFDYVVCKEVEKYRVEVTGSFWNTNETPVAGSQASTWVLERKKGGLSQTVYGQAVNQNDPSQGRRVDMFQYMNANNTVRQACSMQRQALAQSQRAKSQTPCSGSSLR